MTRRKKNKLQTALICLKGSEPTFIRPEVWFGFEKKLVKFDFIFAKNPKLTDFLKRPV